MDRMKNMIVVKDLKSNLIEEAIVVFKENAKIREQNLIKKINTPGEEKSLKDDLCVKEAEIIISDYISKVESKTTEEKLYMKCRALKIINIVLVVIAIFFALI